MLQTAVNCKAIVIKAFNAAVNCDFLLGALSLMMQTLHSLQI